MLYQARELQESQYSLKSEIEIIMNTIIKIVYSVVHLFLSKHKLRLIL